MLVPRDNYTTPLDSTSLCILLATIFQPLEGGNKDLHDNRHSSTIRPLDIDEQVHLKQRLIRAITHLIPCSLLLHISQHTGPPNNDHIQLRCTNQVKPESGNRSPKQLLQQPTERLQLHHKTTTRCRPLPKKHPKPPPPPPPLHHTTHPPDQCTSTRPIASCPKT